MKQASLFQDNDFTKLSLTLQWWCAYICRTFICIYCSMVLLWNFQLFASPFLWGLNSPKQTRPKQRELFSIPFSLPSMCWAGTERGWLGRALFCWNTSSSRGPQTSSSQENQGVCNNGGLPPSKRVTCHNQFWSKRLFLFWTTTESVWVGTLWSGQWLEHLNAKGKTWRSQPTGKITPSL